MAYTVLTRKCKLKRDNYTERISENTNVSVLNYTQILGQYSLLISRTIIYILLKNSLIIQEENAKKNHKRVVS